MSEQSDIRRAAIEARRAAGIDPYGSVFPGTESHATYRQYAQTLDIAPGTTDTRVRATPQRAAGRIMLMRVMGNLIFLTARDQSGDMQYAISRKSVTPQEWEIAKGLYLGDIIGIEFNLGRTKTGEVTCWATSLRLLSSAIQPPPPDFFGLQDTEARYRRRYVDLFSNPDVMRTFRDRSRIVHCLRQMLHDRNFVEVETPVLQPIYGGAAARPFTTHHNKLGMELYLRISPELYLKRCLVGGMPRVFEIGRCFRNEGIDTRHNPEFTMLEAYMAYGDYNDMMTLAEELIGEAAHWVLGDNRRIRWEDGREIDFYPSFFRLRYADLFAQHVMLDINDLPAIRARARSNGIDEAGMDDAVVINELFEHYVEPHLIAPTFVLDYPAALCPLTRRDPANPAYAQRFELYIGGMEVANAYTELNDPDVQRQNLQTRLRGEGDSMAVMDEDFLAALECGMPPAGGIGIGIDRLVMLLTNRPSIREVILFPLQRPTH